jgi:hypothetical protein
MPTKIFETYCHRVWEFKGEDVCPDHSEKFDNLHSILQVPIMPPTIHLEVCSVIQISYELYCN